MWTTGNETKSGRFRWAPVIASEVRVDRVAFDLYGTLLDVSGLAERLRPFAGDAARNCSRAGARRSSSGPGS